METHLLLAEDSATQAYEIRGLLEEAGFDVDVAKNGSDALTRVRQREPDLVVTDLEMPEMNGLELVLALQQEFQQLPVVLITANGSESIAAQALSQGAASYVPKRVMRTELVPALNRIVAVQQARRNREQVDAFIASAETEFHLENDSQLVPLLVVRLQDELGRLGLCDENERARIATAFDEALVNAMIHGNLEVSSELRANDDGKQYYQLIEQRRQQLPYRDRRVVVKVRSSRAEASIAIRDEGPGFNPADVPDPTDPANLERVSGRGLMLINAFMDEVSHNEKGNEIKMVKKRRESPTDRARGY